MAAGGKTIVVVDDDFGIRESIRFVLQLDGFAVEDYASAASFLAACDPAHVDCLLIDYAMPETNGMTLAAQLRVFGVTTPIVIMTADPSSDVDRLAEGVGIYGIIRKPFTLEGLRQVLVKAMAAGPMGSA